MMTLPELRAFQQKHIDACTANGDRLLYHIVRDVRR